MPKKKKKAKKKKGGKKGSKKKKEKKKEVKAAPEPPPVSLVAQPAVSQRTTEGWLARVTADRERHRLLRGVILTESQQRVFDALGIAEQSAAAMRRRRLRPAVPWK